MSEGVNTVYAARKLSAQSSRAHLLNHIPIGTPVTVKNQNGAGNPNQDQPPSSRFMTSTRQDPSPAHLEVRPSQIQGRGLFATTILPAKRKLGEVSGTLVKLPQARHKVQWRQRIYLVEVSRRLALDCSRGNFFRFLNHSCRPNCYLRVYRHRVEVYTLAPLAPGTELTVDYGATPHQDGMKCRCGNATCRTVL